MTRLTVLLLVAAFDPACCADSRPGLLQGQGGDLPPDPGPPGWQPQARAAAAPPQDADRPFPDAAQAVAREPPAALPGSFVAQDRSESASGGRQMPWQDDGYGTLPHGDFAAFGGEDIGQSLTAASISESNKMIDQIERAEVAETKRSVYRALTRLRGAATAAYDGVAKTQMGNIDEYAVGHRFRQTHEIKHLANDERDVKTWAFPEGRYPRSPAGAPPPVSLAAHTSNTTRSGAGFWQGFFSNLGQDGSSGTGKKAIVQAFDSAISASEGAREIATAHRQEKPGGHFWAHFFEEESGLPDRK